MTSNSSDCASHHVALTHTQLGMTHPQESGPVGGMGQGDKAYSRTSLTIVMRLFHDAISSFARRAKHFYRLID